ncbi:MAG TPA: DUF5931 domain-containing protein, partial [Nocardioides sp.]|nr:DUF5931 domain-containing protein [Nocardioides sp.]
MFRALAILRIAVTVFAVVRAGVRNNFDHPAAAWACVALMVAWTIASIWLYAAPARRTAVLLVADLGFALAALLATPIVKGPWFHATIPGYWIIPALIAWAVRYGWVGGLSAGTLLGVTDLLCRQIRTGTDWGNLFLLMLTGAIVGFLCSSLQQMAAEREQAQHELAVASERARLARAVHDGVLQVLALVQRRGAELGGEAAELGRLAGE